MHSHRYFVTWEIKDWMQFLFLKQYFGLKISTILVSYFISTIQIEACTYFRLVVRDTVSPTCFLYKNWYFCFNHNFASWHHSRDAASRRCMFCLCHRQRTALFGMPPFQLKTKVDTGQTPPSKRLMILKQRAYAPYYPPREGIMHHNCKSQTFLPFCWFRNARNRRSSGWGWKRQGCHTSTLRRSQTIMKNRQQFSINVHIP